MSNQMTTETIKGTKAVGHRLANAHINFVETLMALGNISRADAIKVKDLYLTKKLAKIDVGVGRINVKHGAYLDARAIANAVAMVS